MCVCVCVFMYVMIRIQFLNHLHLEQSLQYLIHENVEQYHNILTPRENVIQDYYVLFRFSRLHFQDRALHFIMVNIFVYIYIVSIIIVIVNPETIVL